jgi:glucose dehydrogenase
MFDGWCSASRHEWRQWRQSTAPADAEGVPPIRYVTWSGVMAATSPPSSTLTAHDLNQGAIRWQLATGDDPSTLGRGGPKGTGGLLLRTGIMPTKSGLVFLAGLDGTVRAIEEDTGKTLWTGTIPASSRGIAAMYESKGRQFLLVSGVTSSTTSTAPRGWIAFALPLGARPR